MGELLKTIFAREEEREKKSCRGLLFRANVSHCTTVRGLLFSVRLNLLKKKSCPGCDCCFWVWEAFDEVSKDFPVIGIEKSNTWKNLSVKINP